MSETASQIRQRLVSRAVSYLGCKESDGSHKKIIDLYNSHKPLAQGYKVSYTDPWCDAFASACAIAEELTDIIPTECGCGCHIALFQKLGRWVENDAYVPSPGDYIFYDWQDSGSGDNTGSPDHVGIVVSVTGGVIKVIEGNKSDAVGYRSIAVNGRYIRGFGVPDYESKATAEESSAVKDDSVISVCYGAAVPVELHELTRGSYGSEVKTLQRILYSRGIKGADGKAITVDGEFGPNTTYAVKAAQELLGISADGVVGKITWAKLLKELS